MVVVRRTRVCVRGEMFVVVFVVRFVSGMRGEGFDSAGRRRELAMFFRHVHAGKERRKVPWSLVPAAVNQGSSGRQPPAQQPRPGVPLIPGDVQRI
jgi:hypothetical protein